ncbi:hypothetical protein Marme_1607 [Marinomonas mediterranea MMB-1]|jgi:hypothetical protein|uniref:Uncharacterized protein n=1 Tax=Marinomonas mediterranea (strain ATCC 700492 / JCM 21426 / NBRC 103028 / MMB-1) TaxID=717774 RepID=F2JZ06_MARM1|nr:hypothetical protein Marme_1607 [Marinomonas mediterranea MMB-1]
MLSVDFYFYGDERIGTLLEFKSHPVNDILLRE